MKSIIFLSALGLTLAQNENPQETGFLAFASKAAGFFKNHFLNNIIPGGVGKDLFLSPGRSFENEGGLLKKLFGKKSKGHKHKKGHYHSPALLKYKQLLKQQQLANTGNNTSTSVQNNRSELSKLRELLKQKKQTQTTPTTLTRRTLRHKNRKGNSNK